jgi:hypothetical protein
MLIAIHLKKNQNVQKSNPKIQNPKSNPKNQIQKIKSKKPNLSKKNPKIQNQSKKKKDRNLI